MSRQIVIVGAGIAGLTTAIALKKGGATPIVVAKGELGQSNTALAQGGIAAVVFADDSVFAHEEDTHRAGAGHCNGEAVAQLCERGPEAIAALLDAQVLFDRDQNGEFVKGLEGAHSYPRILHSGGDATGLAISQGLLAYARQLGVQLLPKHFVREITIADGSAVGVEVIDPNGNELFIAADAVALATGGAGQLYRHTTNPVAATCDGLALALRAGAQVSDTEFVQFHPTALLEDSASDQALLISEAVRGAGAVLLNQRGERFMLAEHPDAELAPRDVVARAIARELLSEESAAVFLDARGIENLGKRFPTITRSLSERGIDWREELVPVAPAAHYFMGGVVTDLNGATNIAGLYAVGEVACTGVHGANRLASNSLLEGVVFGLAAAQALLEQRPQNASDPAPPVLQISEAAEALTEGGTAGEAFSRAALQRLMWEKLGLSRNETGMLEAAARLAAWQGELSERGGSSIQLSDLENRNLLISAQEITRAALARRESLGAHWRSDSISSDTSAHSVFTLTN